MVNELLTPIKLRIFNCLELQESDVVLGDLNLFGWVIFKSDSKLNEILITKKPKPSNAKSPNNMQY